MEDGPASRTRSSAGQRYDIFSPLRGSLSASLSDPCLSKLEEKTVFKTPNVIGKKNKGKARTPSGQISTNSGEDIRNFFSQDSQSNIDFASVTSLRLSSNESVNSQSDQNQSTVSDSQTLLQGNSKSKHRQALIDSFNRETYSVKQHSRVNKGANQSIANNNQDKQLQLDGDELIGDKCNQKIIDQTSVDINSKKAKMKDPVNLVEMQKQLADSQLKNKLMIEERIKELEKMRNTPEEPKLAKSNENIAMETSSKEICGEDPTVMDVGLVITMFKELKDHMTSTTINNGSERILKIEDRQIKDTQQMNELKEEGQMEKMKSKILNETVIHMGDMIQDLEKKVEMLELNNMKQSMVMSGFIRTTKKAECIQELEQFFEQEMEIYPEITDVFFYSKNSTNPLTITFASMQDKRMIYQNFKKIKDLENQDGQKYFLNDQLPANINETRRREREISKLNTVAQADVKKDMVMRGGKLIVEGNQFKCPIEVPGPKQILSLTNKKIQEAIHMKVASGNKIEKLNSVFIGYTKPITTIDEINQIYVKLKLCHAEARHIVCCYRINGLPVHEAEGFCDDQEPGGGRVLLRWMRDHRLNNRACFVVRKYGGIKMGPERFVCLKEAIKDAIQKDSTFQGFDLENENEQEQEEVLQDGWQQTKKNGKKTYRRPASQSEKRGGQRKRRYTPRISGERQRGSLVNTQREGTFEPRGLRNQDPKQDWSNDYNYNFAAPDHVLNEKEWLSIPSNRQRRLHPY